MRALDRKLLRDLWRLRGLIASTALVIGAGVALFVMATGALASLQATRTAYYDRYGVADLSATLKRAPLGLLERVRAMPGIQAAEGRVTAGVRIEVPGFDEPASGIAHSLGPQGKAGLNRTHLVRGRLPDPQRIDEILVNEAFANAHGLTGGDRITIVVRGFRQELSIVGTAQSPDHVYTVPPGNMMSDDRRFAILWMPRRALEGPMDLVGAFNDLMVSLEHGASAPGAIAAMDALLAPFGGNGTLALDEQVSDKFLTSEMDQLGTMARLLPPMFLGVAAFLLWVMIGRLVATEREQIGLLKAFGYRNGEVAFHYARLSILIALVGIALGSAAGTLLGRGITGIYARFYQFPLLIFHIEPSVYAQAAAIGVLAAVAGVTGPVRQAVRLSPAAAIQPPVPPRYAGSLAAGLARLRLLDETGRMILRHILHRPGRSFFSILGIAMATGLTIVSSFNLDAIDRMLDFGFNYAGRQAATVAFAEPRTEAALAELAGLPGVLAVEPFRAVPARFRNGHKEWREALTGLSPGSTMVRLIDTELRPVSIPAEGIVLSQSLADRLDAGVGTMLDVEIFEGRRPTLSLRVVQVVSTYQGTPAYIDMAALDRALMQRPLVSGAYLAIDPALAADLHAAVKQRPMIATLSLRSAVLGNFQQQIEDNLGAFRLYSLTLAAIMVVGVVYNNARLSFSEQVRDLATMRVLGYRPGEVGHVLVGELVLLTLAALPLGVVIGLGLAWYVAQSFSSDMYSIPFAVSSSTIAMALATSLLASVATALTVHLRIRRLDLVRVLKSRD